MAATLAWSTAAVGGVYLWASLPVVLLSLGATLLTRPHVLRRADTRLVDLALVLSLVAIALQLFPLPDGARWFISPRLDVDRVELLLSADAASHWRPLSLYPGATLLGLALVTSAALVFWCARYLCGHGHALGLANAVAGIGLVSAVVAVVQRGVDPTRIYGIWAPLDAGARPFGPFVNRNHFGTWLVLAAPLVAGTVVTALRSRRRSTRVASEVAAGLRAIGSRGGWLVVSCVAMSVTLVLTYSRGAMVAGVAACLAWGVLAIGRSTRRGLAGGAVAVVVVALLASWLTPSERVWARVRETLALGAAERGTIWTDARTVAAAYPAAGTGLGSFERSMLVYQSSERATRSNQAHSQYLQLAAEGGGLLLVPAAFTCLAFGVLALRRLGEDDTATVWLRVGALAGIVGVLVQSLWETGLRMPANGVLLAITAAIAVHRPARQR